MIFKKILEIAKKIFIVLKIAKDQFTITSPKNADVRIFGGKAKLGRMSAASPFVVSGKYMLILPIADFYTYDGVRLDRVGVNPDIEVKSEEALNKVLEIINGGGN